MQVCDECGGTEDVRLINFKRGQRVVREALCVNCKEAMLVRVKVRAPVKQRALLTLRRAGFILIAAGVLALVALIVWVATG